VAVWGILPLEKRSADHRRRFSLIGQRRCVPQSWHHELQAQGYPSGYILGRVLHRIVTININGESYWLHEKWKAGRPAPGQVRHINLRGWMTFNVRGGPF
jgi:hypothetical protein